MSDFSLGARRDRRLPSLRHVIADAALVLRSMLRARATRRLLTQMDDRLLADIGVGRGDAIYEARRPMWDLTRRRE